MARGHTTDPVPSRAALLGTCATLADRTGINTALLRIVALILLCMAFKLTLIAYCIAAVAFRTERR